MKKILLSGIIAVIISISTFGQTPILNMDFEHWEYNEIGGFWDPISWVNPNPFIAGTLQKICVFQSTDNVSGNYSVYLETQDTLAYVIPGLITYGDFVIDFINVTAWVENGIPFTDRPKALSGSYKAYPASGDFGMITVIFTKYNTDKGQRDTIASELLTFPAVVDTWTEFNLPITFNTDDDPDTMNIIALSSNILAPQAGGSMYLDHLVFEYEAGVGDVEESIASSVFPNPVNENLSFVFDKEVEAELRIFNNNGQLVQQITVSGNELHTDVSGLAAGNYYYGLFDKNKKISSGQFVISR